MNGIQLGQVPSGDGYGYGVFFGFFYSLQRRLTSTFDVKNYYYTWHLRDTVFNTYLYPILVILNTLYDSISPLVDNRMNVWYNYYVLYQEIRIISTKVDVDITWLCFDYRILLLASLLICWTIYNWLHTDIYQKEIINSFSSNCPLFILRPVIWCSQ